MAIIGTNTLLNQYVPRFYIKDISENQILIYDAIRKSFVNEDISIISGGPKSLGQLINVDSSVDNPLSLSNGQALVYNTLTDIWENKFVDYNTLLNKPTGIGTVTSVSVTAIDGIIATVTDGTIAPNISLSLGAITPTSISSPGTIIGSNLSGINTGDQTITLTGDISGSGTGSFVTSLSTTGVTAGTYGSSTLIPVFTVNAKGRITLATTAIVDTGSVGSIKSLIIDVPLNTNGITNFGSLFPAGCTILRTKVIITIADNAATLVVGIAGITDKYMTASENNPQALGTYVAEVFIDEVGSIQGFATVANTAGTAGASCRIIIEYKL